MQQLDTRLDPTWDQNKRRPDHDLLESLIGTAALSTSARSGIVRRAVGYVQAVRSGARPGLMEAFLAEYGLSSDEGVALMCLAEALLRIPDARTIDALIDDKIAGSDWSEHLGQSGSLLVNSSTLGLLLAGQVLNTRADDGGHSVADTLQGLTTSLAYVSRVTNLRRAAGGRDAENLEELKARTQRGYGHSLGLLPRKITWIWQKAPAVP